MKTLMILGTLLVLNGCVDNPEPPDRDIVYTHMGTDKPYNHVPNFNDKPEVYPVNSWSNNDAAVGNTYNRTNDILYDAKVRDTKLISDPDNPYLDYIKENR